VERTLALNPDLHTLSGLPKYEAGNLLYIGNQIKVDSLKCCSKVLFSHLFFQYNQEVLIRLQH